MMDNKRKIEGQPIHALPMPPYGAAASPQPAGVRVRGSYRFDRYINGKLMSEGVTIEGASSIEQAMIRAASIAPKGTNRETPVLVLSALEPQQEEPVEYRQRERAPGGEWSKWYPSTKSKFEEWAAGRTQGFYNEYEVQPLYAHPTTQQPLAITEEMVERLLAHAKGTRYGLRMKRDQAREALNAALVKP